MEQAKKKKKRIIALVIVAVILVVIIGGFVACSKALSASIEQLSSGFTELSTVEKRDISNTISVSGSVESESLVKITSTLTAKVKTVNVEVGSEVKEGDVLLEFDSEDLQQQYDTLKKSMENADNLTAHNHTINERNLENAKRDKKTNLEQAQRSIDDAISARDKAYAKEADLVNKYNAQLGTVNDISARLNAAEDPEIYVALSTQLQEAQMTLSGYDTQLESIREQLPSFDSAVQTANDAYAQTERSADQMIQSYQDVLDNEQFSNDNSSENELKKLEDAIKDCTVRATKSGIVTSLNVAEGSIPTAEALMTIEDKDTLKITVSIAEADILKVQEGQKAIVKTTATGDQEFDATISRVVNIYKSNASASMYGQSESGGYSAEITIDDKDTGLLIGMNAKVQIILSEKKQVLSVPYESIVDDEDGSKHVLLAVTDASTGVTTAKAVKVETGMEGSYYTEITSGELNEGDKIVMEGASYQDGDMLLLVPNMNDAGGTEDEAVTDE